MFAVVPVKADMMPLTSEHMKWADTVNTTVQVSLKGTNWINITLKVQILLEHMSENESIAVHAVWPLKVLEFLRPRFTSLVGDE